MNYININKKRLVGRNNQQLTNQIIIDYSTIEDISFQLINDQNQIQEISDLSGLYLAGSIGIGKQSYELLFLSKEYTVTPENIIVFSLDTYTTNYLNYIKKKNTEINIEIGQESLNTKKVILRDYALACPRVYVSGLSPQEIESKNFYTKTEVDELFSDLFIPTKVSQLENDSGFISGYTETDPIYTADKPSIALKSELFSGSYNDLTDKPSIPSKTSDLTNDSGFISGYTETDPIYTADKPSIALKNEIPTKVSELDNDSGFISGYTETDPVYSATSGQFQLKEDAFSGSYNDLTDKPSIPSKTSELQNDSGFISGYTETDPIYTAEKSTLALKSEIPLSTSQLTNDSGFISGYTETDPIFTAVSGSFVQTNQSGRIPTSVYGTNKHKVLNDSTPHTGTFELSYNPDYDIFISEITLSSSTLDIGQIDFTENSLSGGETATLENWFVFTNQDDAETISINSNITTVGDIPETLSGTQIHVFVRRVYKDSNNTIHEAISYGYSF